MQDGIGIGKKTLANLTRFPGVRGRVKRHINDHRGADNIITRNAAPEAAIVRIAAVIAHHKIAIVGDLVRRAELVRFDGTVSIILGESLAINPYRAIADFESVARQADDALDVVRRVRRKGRLENDDLLEVRSTAE